jgi:hypothetical protein
MRLIYNTTPVSKFVLPARAAWPVLAFITATFLFSNVGCSRALRISHRPVGSTIKPESVPGVPFYTKRARCRQEVVWFEPIYTLTLGALLPDKDGVLQNHPRGVVTLSRTDFESQEVTDFMKLLNNRPTDEATVLRAWMRVVTRANSGVLSRDFGSLKAADRILVGRSAAPVVYVDYANQYYVNVKIPWAGSANLDAKVADDGSLSEVSGQVETKTLETILGAIPTSTLISGALGLSGGKSIAGAGEVEAFQLTVSISGYRHTLARLVDYPATSAPCPVAMDIPLSDATEYKREDISAASDSTNADKTGGADAASSKDSTGGDKTKKSKK